MFSVLCVFIHSKSPGRLLLCTVRILVCAGACVCVCVCVCARACVRVCVCARVLRIVSRDQILRFKNTFIIIIYFISA